MLHGKPDIARTGKMLAHLGFHGEDDLFVPSMREASASAVLRHPELGQIRRIKHKMHFCLQTFTALVPRRIGTNVPKINLVNDCQHRDFKQNRVKP